MLVVTPNKIKNADLDGVLRLYGTLYWDSTGHHPDLGSIPKVRRILNTILETYSVTQLYVLIFCHFEWYRETGEDHQVYRNLLNNSFPLEWLISRKSAYAAYIKKTLPPGVWEDDKKLQKILDLWMKTIWNKKTP